MAEKKKTITKKTEEKVKIKELSDLPGIGPTTIDKLKDIAIMDLMGLAVSDPMTLASAGITGKTAVDIIKLARESLQLGFEEASKVEIKRSKVQKISTGLKSFDDLIDGGYETGSITEVFGEWGSSKTQLAHILSINTIKQYPDGEVFFIDSENTFRPDRIRQLAKGAGIDEEDALKRIKVARAYNVDHQLVVVDKAEELIASKKNNVKTIIIDSLTSHFRAEYSGMGSLAPRQQRLNKHMHKLVKIADKYGIVVFVTNQVMSKPGQMFGDPTHAIGGHIVGHNSCMRIFLRKGKKDSRVAKLVDSPNLPNGEVNFYVEESGLKEV